MPQGDGVDPDEGLRRYRKGGTSFPGAIRRANPKVFPSLRPNTVAQELREAIDELNRITTTEPLKTFPPLDTITTPPITGTFPTGTNTGTGTGTGTGTSTGTGTNTGTSTETGTGTETGTTTESTTADSTTADSTTADSTTADGTTADGTTTDGTTADGTTTDGTTADGTTSDGTTADGTTADYTFSPTGDVSGSVDSLTQSPTLDDTDNTPVAVFTGDEGQTFPPDPPPEPLPEYDADNAKSVSVVIASVNEGVDLETTVAMAVSGKPAPDELVLVDDDSQQPLEPRVRPICEQAGVPLVSIRNDTRRGSGPSKHQGCEAASGDLIVTLDGHMRVPFEWLKVIQQAHAHAPDAILWPCNKGFLGHHYGRNAALKYTDIYGDKEKKVFQGRRWRHKWVPAPTRLPPVFETPIMLGACYVIPRNIHDDVGGYAPGLRGYGNEEEWLGWRTWAFGWRVGLIRDLDVQHQYDRKIDRNGASGKTDDAPGMMYWNSLVLSWCMFADEALSQRFVNDSLESLVPADWRKMLRAMVREHGGGLEKLRSWFNAKRVRDDDTMIALTQIHGSLSKVGL